MNSPSGYTIVKLASGACSVHSLAVAETFHPVIGPTAEAESLYVRQLQLVERFQRQSGEFVVWDVGLGAAANVVTVLRALSQGGGLLRLLSFDHTLEPLQFALKNTEHLPYLVGFEEPLTQLLTQKHVEFKRGSLSVVWDLFEADFPTLLTRPEARVLAKPHAVLFDAYSPARNPAMWTQPLFAGLYQLLEPQRPCALPTYSRSTMLRVTLLLAGFFVGVGHSTGQKEETTVAANRLELLAEPLDGRWLERAHRSSSAEPMWTAAYHQKPLTAETWEKLRQHPQFQS